MRPCGGGTVCIFGGASVLASRLVSSLAPPDCTTAATMVPHRASIRLQTADENEDLDDYKSAFTVAPMHPSNAQRRTAWRRFHERNPVGRDSVEP